jgi:pimeloyl-ACP methyl ester carboxylesterase
MRFLREDAQSKMKRSSITIAVIVGVVAIFIAMTYPRYHREMIATKARLLAGATILKTDHGDIEYAIEGQGAPVLSLHGAGGGYDQGLWAAKMAFGDGHKVISVSRFGYLRTPIPQNASLKTQAALYRDLLDHLRIQKVIVLGSSAGGPSATQFANDYSQRTSALILLSAVSEASRATRQPFTLASFTSSSGPITPIGSWQDSCSR